MLRTIRLGLFIAALMLAQAVAPASAIQDAGSAASPVPSPSPSHKKQKVFISNTSDGNGVVFADLPRLTYNRFYAAIKNSERYELISSRASADLIFEVNYSEPWEFILPKLLSPLPADDTSCGYSAVRAIQDHDYAPQVRLGVWNATSKTFLGGFVEPFHPASVARVVSRDTREAYKPWTQLAKVSDAQLNENLDAAIEVLVNRARHLLEQPPISISFPQKVDEAPVTAQIARATRIFISNPGADHLEAIPGADQLYDSVVSEIKRWGRFEIVSEPQSADLVFNLSLLETPRVFIEIKPQEPYEREVGIRCFVQRVRDRQIKLSILGPRDPIVLWGFFQPADAQFPDGLPKERLEHATRRLLDTLHRVVERSAAAGSAIRSSAQ